MSLVDDTALNPYQSPQAAGEPAVTDPRPARLAVGTATGSRFLAAQMDHAFAVVLFFVAAMSLADERPFQVIPGVAALGMYLGYYFFSEWLLGGTLGKLFFGIRVRQLSGERCTPAQIAIRTILRVVEVNPLLLGALPAGIAILATSRRQRVGDLLAGTVVVRASDG
jgi:uncharacterized RDD family membrane protein YckC